MVKIRVTCGGCGIEYTDEHGNARHTLKTAESGPFMCDAEQADRLVRLGVAAYVTTKELDKKEEGSDQDPGEIPDTQTGYLSAEDLENTKIRVTRGILSREDLANMSKEDLSKLAEKFGIKKTGSKKDLVEQLSQCVVGYEDEEIMDEEEVPDLNAEEPD